MLVIVDHANTQRIQDLLNKQLRDYENEMPLVLPNRQAWTMTNSLNYAWGLLTTLGKNFLDKKLLSKFTVIFGASFEK